MNHAVEQIKAAWEKHGHQAREFPFRCRLPEPVRSMTYAPPPDCTVDHVIIKTVQFDRDVRYSCGVPHYVITGRLEGDPNRAKHIVYSEIKRD